MKDTTILRVPTDKVSIVECDCGKHIFIHGKLDDFMEFQDD